MSLRSLLSSPSPQVQPLDGEGLSRVPSTGRSQKGARPRGASTVPVLEWVRGMRTAISAGEYLRPRSHHRRETGSQICKDMKTYSGGGPKGVVKFHSDGSPLVATGWPGWRSVTAPSAGRWRYEGGRSWGRRGAGRYSSSSTESEADGEAGAPTQASSTWAEVRRRTRR
jgi:hypothetical protein